MTSDGNSTSAAPNVTGLAEQARRSRRRYLTVVSLAAVALVLAGVAFYVSLSENWQHTAAATEQAQDATRRANLAIVRANTAARDAEQAAAHAEQAHQAADRAHADLCRFLAVIRTDRNLDESLPARRLYVEFQCVSIRR